MKKLIIALTILCANTISAQYFPVDTLKLNGAYEALMKAPSDSAAQWAFFNAFPGTWLNYINTYNYINVPGYDLTMYDKSVDHCDAFRDLTAIPDSIYCAKLVDIAVGAIAAADVPNYLKGMEHTAMRTKRDAMLASITDMMTGDRMLFWQFYWSNPIYSDALKKDYQELDAYMRSHGYADEAELMKIAFDHFHGKSIFELNSHHVGLRQYESSCH